MISQLISAETVHRWCLAQPRSHADQPFGVETTVFRFQSTKKMFALHWLQTPHAVQRLYGRQWQDGITVVNLKAEPALSEQLRSAYWQIKPGYHMNKTHWNSVAMVADADLSERMLKDLIEDSYDLVANG